MSKTQQPPSEPSTAPDWVEDAETRNLQFLQELLADEKIRDHIASQCQIHQWDESEWTYFRADRGGPPCPGRISFVFYPLWLGDWARRKAAEITKPIYRAWLLASVKPEWSVKPESVVDHFLQSEKGQALAAKFCASVEEQAAQALAIQFLFALSGRLSKHLENVEEQTCCVVQGWLQEDFNLNNDISEGYLVGHVVKKLATETRQFLKMALSAAEPRWEIGRSRFEKLLPEAAAAKKLYRSNRLRDWRAMIKAGFPDFHADLVDALDPEVTARLRDDYSLPAHMALEQTARFCGAKPFSFSPRRIREKIYEATAIVAAESDKAQ